MGTLATICPFKYYEEGNVPKNQSSERLQTVKAWITVCLNTAQKRENYECIQLN